MFETLKTGLESLETDVTDNYVKKDALEIVKGQLDAVKAGVSTVTETFESKQTKFHIKVESLHTYSVEMKNMVSRFVTDLMLCSSQIGQLGNGLIEMQAGIDAQEYRVYAAEEASKESVDVLNQYLPTLLNVMHASEEHVKRISLTESIREEINDALLIKRSEVQVLMDKRVGCAERRASHLADALTSTEAKKTSDLDVSTKELERDLSAAEKGMEMFHATVDKLSEEFSAVKIEDSTSDIASVVAGLAASTSHKPAAPVLSGGSAAFTPVPCVLVSSVTPPAITTGTSAAAAATSVVESLTTLSSTSTTVTALPSVAGSGSEVCVVAAVAAGVSGDVRAGVAGTASVFELLAGDISNADLHVTFVEVCTQVHQQVFGKNPSFNYETDPMFIDALKSVTFSGLAFDEDRFDIVSSGMIDADRGVVDGSCIPPGKSIDELKKIFPVRRSFVGMKNDESKQRLFKLFMEQFMKSGHPVITDIWKVFKVVADF